MLIRRKNFNSPILRWGGIVLFSLTFFAVFGDQGLRKLHQTRSLEDRLEKQMLVLGHENERLVQELKRLGDLAYLEKIVRDEMGYLRSDEVVYYLEKRNQ